MNRASRGVSPVVAVILMVAVTVILSAAVGAFVFDLGQSTDTGKQSIGITMSQTSDGTEVTVVTGEADRLQVIVNGVPAETIRTPTPGDMVTVTTEVGDSISITSTASGETRVLSTTTIDSRTKYSDGLVAHYQLGASEGTTAHDTAGSNDGIINGATWDTDGSQYFLSFDGTDDHINVSHSTTLDMSSEITVSAWVKTSSWNKGRFAEKMDWGNAEGYSLQPTGSDIRFYIGDGSDRPMANTSSYPSSGTWHFIVGTFDGSTIRLYIDGELNATQSQNGIVGTGSTHKLNIGGDVLAGGRFFNGDIRDVRIYNRTLTEQEVEGLYDATK